MNVLAIARKDLNIDPDRIYLMGHSMGGGGTWHLGIKYPDIWAGLGPIAPAIFRPATEVEKIKHIPVFLVQGDQDTLVPVAGARRWAEQMKKLEMTHEYIEVAGAITAMSWVPTWVRFSISSRNTSGRKTKVKTCLKMKEPARKNFPRRLLIS
jgi:predicted peptidase